MFWFAIASLSPAVLLVLGCLFGGPFPLLAVLSMTGVVYGLDRLSHRMPQTGTSGHGLSVLLALVHFPLLALVIWTIGQASHVDAIDKALLFLGIGLFAGQVSNANAHELIHARNRWSRRFGAAVYTSMLYGHHVSAHMLVHHVHAGTAADPNSAPKGRGFWSYARRAVIGEFMAGLRAETARRRDGRVMHPYVAYLGGAALALLVSYAFAGGIGVALHIALAVYAQMQLLLSDYVQHYGLRRRMTAEGKPEPMGPQHSWNAPQWYSNAMMLNAPQHSAHHMRPDLAYPDLTMAETMPTLPRSLPVMATVALFPSLWRRIMDPRVEAWQNPAEPLAAPDRP